MTRAGPRLGPGGEALGRAARGRIRGGAASQNPFELKAASNQRCRGRRLRPPRLRPALTGFSPPHSLSATPTTGHWPGTRCSDIFASEGVGSGSGFRVPFLALAPSSCVTGRGPEPLEGLVSSSVPWANNNPFPEDLREVWLLCRVPWACASALWHPGDQPELALVSSAS